MEVGLKGIGPTILFLVLSNFFAQNSARIFSVKNTCRKDKEDKTVTVCDHVESSIEDPAVFVPGHEYDDREAVRFENSNLPVVPENLFRTFRHLVNLEMNDCGIRYIRASNFQNSTSLVVLTLQNNEIETLPSEVFQFVSSLRYLSLSNNKVSTMWWDTFKGLSRLKWLLLENNKITTLPVRLFKPLTSLQLVFLQNNQIEVIEKDVFEGNSLLRGVYLSKNEIKVIESGSLKELETGGVERCEASTTKVIPFRNNSLSEISNLGQLYDLDIAQNPVGVLAANALSNLTRLKHLNLSSISIRELHEDTFQSQKQLETLDLSGNFLERFDLKTIQHMKNLRELYIADNQIQELDYHNLKDFLPSLTELDISGNAFNCADLIEIMDYLRAHSIWCLGAENMELNCSSVDRISTEPTRVQCDNPMNVNAITDPLREEIRAIKSKLLSLKDNYGSKIDEILEIVQAISIKVGDNPKID